MTSVCGLVWGRTGATSLSVAWFVSARGSGESNWLGGDDRRLAEGQQPEVRPATLENGCQHKFVKRSRWVAGALVSLVPLGVESGC